MNSDFCSSAETAQEPPQRGRLQSDTACRWAKSGASQVDENRAAAAGHARARVVVELNDQVVQMIASPQAITSLARCQAQGLVVTAVLRVFAPRIEWRDAAGRKLRLRPRRPVRAPPQSLQAEPSTRCSTVAFPLVRLDASPAERNRERVHPNRQPAAAAVANGCAHLQKAHGFALDFPAVPLPHALIIPAKHGYRRLLFFPRVLYFAQCRFGGSPQGVVP